MEILVVVVIATLVLSFSVPYYKKTQEKNRYLAALGVLTELGNGMRMLREAHPEVSSTSLAVTTNATSGNEDLSATGENAVSWMMQHKYITPIRFVDGQYMGYSFAVSASANAACGSACSPSGAVACMSGTNEIREYQCAYMDQFGEIHNYMGGISL